MTMLDAYAATQIVAPVEPRRWSSLTFVSLHPRLSHHEPGAAPSEVLADVEGRAVTSHVQSLYQARSPTIARLRRADERPAVRQLASTSRS